LPGVSASAFATKDGIMLAPGVVFRPHLQPSPWLRFNVTSRDNPRVLRSLERVAAQPAKTPPQAAE